MFDEIYKIVMESDSFEELKNGLLELKRKLGKLDINAKTIKDGSLFTVPGLLAKEVGSDPTGFKYDQKIEWMRQLRADVNYIAYGYALAGHVLAHTYRLQHKADIDAITRGYAEGKHHRQVKDYFNYHNASAGIIAQGYAKAGCNEQVEHYSKFDGTDINKIALNYARGGHHERVEAYRKLGAKVDDIAYGYAVAGYHEQVEIYRKDHGANVNEIAQCYAYAGYHEQVEIYRKDHGANVNEIIAGYEGADNYEKQREYDIRYLLKSYLRERGAVVDANGETKEYFYSNVFSLFQKSYTQKKAAVNALLSALDGKSVDLREHLDTLRNGNLGNELRAFIKAGKVNGLVGEKVTTVSDFVNALQNRKTPDYKPV